MKNEQKAVNLEIAKAKKLRATYCQLSVKISVYNLFIILEVKFTRKSLLAPRGESHDESSS